MSLYLWSLYLLSLVGLAAVVPWLPWQRLRAGNPRQIGYLVLLLAPLLGFVASFSWWRKLPEPWQTPWLESLGLRYSFAVDPLSVVMVQLILLVGFFVLFFSVGYFGKKETAPRFFSLMLLFMTAMLGVVTSDSVWMLFLFWEMTSLLSFFLIGFDSHLEKARKSALQALLITGAGGVLMLGGLIQLVDLSGTSSLREMIQILGAPSTLSPALFVPVLLVVLGALTKSAQFPFHFWLAEAMTAPTPASSYLHSATMVKAGVFLLAKFSPVLAQVPGMVMSLQVIGLITAVWGGLSALGRRDLKQVLAGTTLASLGLLTFLAVDPSVKFQLAFLVFLAAHALYKSLLFLVVGSFDHAAGTRDLFDLRMSLRKSRGVLLLAAAALPLLSLLGVPPTLGFLAKELLLKLTWQLHWWTGALATFALVLAGSAGALLLAPFWSARRQLTTGQDAAIKGAEFTAKRVNTWELAALLPFAFLVSSVVGGWLPSQVLPAFVLGPSTAENFIAAEGFLRWWQGVNTVFVLSVGILMLSLAGALLRLKQSAMTFSLDGVFLRGFDQLWASVLWMADRITRKVQNGSLQFYVFTVLLFLLLGFLYWFVRSGEASFFSFGSAVVAMTTKDLVLGVLMVASVLSVFWLRSPLSVVIVLGVLGFALAVVYASFGAPDLALTQVLIETLTIMIFLYWIRLMPKDSGRPALSFPTWQWLLAIPLAAVFTLMAWNARWTELARPISNYFGEVSYLQAQGKNVVNVIIVDFRALDTLGEITVLAIAALGITYLARGVRAR